jgi:uncharacterized protein YeaO (DUF488 family)
VSLAIKRIYDAPARSDGYRVLVDRLWPRGVSKERAELDLWLKEIAPSTELRKWFGHDAKRWREFQRRYRAELRANKQAVDKLRRLAERRRVTLLYGARDGDHNEAVVLRDYILK